MILVFIKRGGERTILGTLADTDDVQADVKQMLKEQRHLELISSVYVNLAGNEYKVFMDREEAHVK